MPPRSASCPRRRRPRRRHLPPAVPELTARQALLSVPSTGTTHAVLETRDAVHYGQEADGQQPGQQQKQQARRLGGGGGSGGAAKQAVDGGGAPAKDTIHTLCTGNGSPYQVGLSGGVAKSSCCSWSMTLLCTHPQRTCRTTSCASPTPPISWCRRCRVRAQRLQMACQPLLLWVSAASLPAVGGAPDNLGSMPLSRPARRARCPSSTSQNACRRGAARGLHPHPAPHPGRPRLLDGRDRDLSSRPAAAQMRQLVSARDSPLTRMGVGLHARRQRAGKVPSKQQGHRPSGCTPPSCPPRCVPHSRLNASHLASRRCEYPVSDRANAVRQFFEAAAQQPGFVRGEWIYMIGGCAGLGGCTRG